MATATQYPDSDFSEEELSPLDSAFNEAANHVRKLTSKLDNNQLLELYGLYKQAVEGKCDTPRPGWLDGKGRKKWDAWKTLGDMPSEAAKQMYIDLVKKFDKTWTSTAPVTSSKDAWAAVSSLRYTPEPELIQHELSLLDAAREDCDQRVTELLQLNPKLKDEKDEDGLSALHWAADRNATKALTAAIKGGCPVNMVDGFGQTALHYAASCGHMKSTQILVDAGALLIKDEDGCTPVDVAADDEIRDILKAAKSA